MRSRAASRRLKILAGAVGILVAAGLFLLIRPGSGDEQIGAPPTTLAHMAEKNRDAARSVAAHERLQAATSVNEANALVAAEERSGAPANSSRHN